MRHASAAALDTLGPLLAEVRRRGALTERSSGVFYRRSRAWLHFHEDAAGLFADLRDGADFARFRVSESEECAALLAALDRSFEATPAKAGGSA